MRLEKGEAMSRQAAIRANQMLRNKILEAAKALDRAHLVSLDIDHVVFNLPLLDRDHIRGALLQALALTEQVEEEMESDEAPEAVIARGQAILDESQKTREGIRSHLDHLMRGAGEEAGGEK